MPVCKGRASQGILTASPPLPPMLPQSLRISWQSPLFLPVSARTSHLTPSLPARHPASKTAHRLCSQSLGLFLETWQVCLLPSPLRNLNNQWPTTLSLQLQHRSSPRRAGGRPDGR